MISLFIFTFLVQCIFEVSPHCSTVDIKILLEGCDRLTGLNLTFTGGKMVNDDNCDAIIPKHLVTDEPVFHYSHADLQKYYTLLMLDVDRLPQIFGEFYLHLIKSNIPGLVLSSYETNKTLGIDYRDYKPPTPAFGTCPNRYMCLLYEQPNGNNFRPTLPLSRGRFALTNWLRGNNLCGPVASTQFRVQF